METVGLGGSCHWCTEAVFRSLKGVGEVDQGWLSAQGHEEMSEGILLRFDPARIDLYTLIQIHLYTHSCTSNHALRHRYRSAVYAFSPDQQRAAQVCLKALQPEFEQPILTQALRFDAFQPSRHEIQDYFYRNPQKPFCQMRISPKLSILLSQFSDRVDDKKRHVLEQLPVDIK
ncbi:peptide-methionine (S)-S-oxide reductase [Photobacterium halotolerans]|uniref:peptide-methionine (S)-S-oxide reductase n=1 Tax=Photobacterium halotolerans TaxID=265726 RepID=A0A7X4XVL5_9GAMM|nr:peptide-methionine (S)-S-oxide reductase [Photobacterium halotolerans]NAW64309.1 peptide methionine sulfoxide reductase [Photobacterium halotolerans]NAW86124.1 peptide methionine sulfoxide reductase [Photobacterium halotolerans]NAX45790.1 peptide methionine sulfoxide reductase [Photobacterium halotolerans]